MQAYLNEEVSVKKEEETYRHKCMLEINKQ